MCRIIFHRYFQLSTVSQLLTVLTNKNFTHRKHKKVFINLRLRNVYMNLLLKSRGYVLAKITDSFEQDFHIVLRMFYFNYCFRVTVRLWSHRVFRNSSNNRWLFITKENPKTRGFLELTYLFFVSSSSCALLFSYLRTVTQTLEHLTASCYSVRRGWNFSFFKACI